MVKKVWRKLDANRTFSDSLTQFVSVPMVEVVVFIFSGFPYVGRVSVDVCQRFSLIKFDALVLVESLYAANAMSKQH